MLIYIVLQYILNVLKDYIDKDCIIVFDELVNYPGFDGPNLTENLELYMNLLEKMLLSVNGLE